MKHLVYILLLPLLMVDCKTKTIVVPTIEQRDSIRIVYQRDSIFHRDSIFVAEYTRGDTIYHFHETTRLIYHDRAKTDTVAVHQRDTVAVPAPAQQSVSRADKFAIRHFSTLCLLLIAALAWIFRQPIIKLLRRIANK